MYVEDSVRLDDPKVFSASPSWPPSTESMGGNGLVPASISPPVDVGTELATKVLSNGVLNEHPSFSVNNYALRDNQLQCLERWLRRRQVLAGWGLSMPGRVHSLFTRSLMCQDGRQDSRVSQLKFH